MLAATWNVGNAMPPPPEVLAKVWLRGTARGAEHHLVAVAAQECSYLKQARAAVKSGSSKKSGGDGSGDAPRPGSSSSARDALSGNSADLVAGANAAGCVDPTEGAQLLQAPSLAGKPLFVGAEREGDNGDAAADDDDEPLDVASQEETAARLQRAKSLKARVINNIDSAIAWVRRNGMGRAWHSAPASLPWPT